MPCERKSPWRLKLAASATLDRPDGNEVLELGNNPTQAENHTFLQAVQSGDVSAIRGDYSAAVKPLQLSLAATPSAIEGRTISL